VKNFLNKNSVGICLALTVTLLLLLGVTVGAKVKLTYWTSDGGTSLETARMLAQEYMELHPDTEIEVVFVPREQGAYTKLITAVVGGNPPDIAYIDRTMIPSLAVRNALESLTKYAERDGITRDDFYGGAWDDCTWGGHVWAMPMEADPCGLLFWNKAVYEESGLDPDIGPETTTELDDMAFRITKVGPEGTYERVGFAPWWNMGFTFWPYAWAFGGDFYDKNTNKVTANHPRNIRAMEWVETYSKDYDARRLASFESSYFLAEAADAFFTGRVGMKLDGIWTFGSIERYAPELKYGWGLFPGHPDDGRSSNFVLGLSFGIPRGAKHPKEAWEFIRWMTGPYASAKWSYRNSYLPANLEAASSELFAAEPHYVRMIEQMKEVYDHPPVIPAIGLYTSSIQEALQAVVYGQKTPKEALDDVTLLVQEELDQFVD
jgi:multiple sugar transport system substrate-binding protein